MIRPCSAAEVDAIAEVINAAAEVYCGAIPADCWHRPYMPRERLMAEIDAGVAFSAWEEPGMLVGVMGLQRVRDAMLIRHAYVLPAYQARGIGSALLTALSASVAGLLLVGTWAAADWAVRFYVRHGFRQVSIAEKDQLLQTYWSIPERQRESSVVLKR